VNGAKGGSAGNTRSDVALVERGLSKTLALAQPLIMAGVVFSVENRVEKPGQQIAQDAPLEVRGADHPWVSRGGLKLETALDHVSIDPSGLICLDVGASTGGFTDVLLQYIIDLVRATRDPGSVDPSLRSLVEFGASPRASISLAAAAKAHAFLDGRGYTLPEDVKEVATDVLRHRIMPTYEAEADGISPEALVGRILDKVEMP